MVEIYWLTRIIAINEISKIIAILALILCVFCLLGAIVIAEDEALPFFRYLKICFITSCISALVYMFTPSRDELIVIFGLGSTVEYMEGNERAREIPDKAVEKIINWLEEDSSNKSNK